MPSSIPPDYLKRIFRQAEKDYPNETCGILIGPKSDQGVVTKIYACRNVQDEYHHEDPISFPRTARAAYFIDPKDLLKIQKESRQKNCEMRVIYHSHCDAGAYFSEEDQRIALSEGKPTYPGVSYIVVSVQKGKAGEASLFAWNEKEKGFEKKNLRL
ncbi:MAG: M67 family metallopeptidase [Candidatus Omnitrophica bacterium]|nr:M67 family metallopeptidase [Candidatus Omnitrophota bacterium]